MKRDSADEPAPQVIEEAMKDSSVRYSIAYIAGVYGNFKKLAAIVIGALESDVLWVFLPSQRTNLL